MSHELNELECRLVDYLETRMAQRSGNPSYEEIRQALALSSKDFVSRLLDRLETKGYIRRQPGRSRSFELLRSSNGRSFHLSPTVRIPVLAIAPASFEFSPGDGFEPDEYIELTRELIPDEAGIYALHVRGESMIDAMIDDGDVVVLRQQQEALDGDLVQVWVNSEESATLKRFYREGNQICLKPENPALQPRYFPSEDILIQGKVVLVIRQLERLQAA